MMALGDLFKWKALLHIGCKDCSGDQDEVDAAKHILTALKVPFESREFECGCSSLVWGDKEKFLKLVEESRKFVKNKKYVIVGCGRCLYVLKHYHNVPVKHISQVVWGKIMDMELPSVDRGKILYHDPCYLTRYEGVMDEPRDVLRKLGYNVLEFENNRKKTNCCGDYTLFHALRRKIAESRLSEVPSKYKNVPITAGCSTCIKNFRDFNKTSDKKFTINSFLEVIDSALG